MYHKYDIKAYQMPPNLKSQNSPHENDWIKAVQDDHKDEDCQESHALK